MFAIQNSCDRHVKKIHSEQLDSVEAPVEISNLKKKLEEGFNKKCPHCKRYFKYELSRECHVNKFHHSDNNNKEEEDALEEYRCDVCNKISLKRHMVSHSEEPVQFSCQYCDVKKRHSAQAYAKQDVFKCKVCSVDFGQDLRKD